LIDTAWLAETDTIYDSYSIYHKSGGVDQAVFERLTGERVSRSNKILNFISSKIPIPDDGRFLDVGCGNGAFLRSFSENKPGWKLTGTELNDKYQTEIEKIPGLELFHMGNPQTLTGTFDFITMIHVLEHIINPVEFLQVIFNKLNPDGIIIIEIPDFSENPFDLLIVDHCTHFSRECIEYVVRNAGFEILFISNECIPKEITLIGRKKREGSFIQKNKASFPVIRERLLKSLGFLDASLKEAERVSRKKNFGVFGTSIAATWIFNHFRKEVQFFVDEDLTVIGKTIFNLPIYHPSEIQTESNIFIALPHNQAEAIKLRLKKTNKNLHFYAP
jgi:SAM-dependent methyltransferase